MIALKPRSLSGESPRVLTARSTSSIDRSLSRKLPRRGRALFTELLFSKGPGRMYYDDKVACRAVGVDATPVGARGSARGRVRRLYMVRISNKLSADPLARSLVYNDINAPACVRCHCYRRVFTRACGRRVSRHFETRICKRATETSTYKNGVINDATTQWNETLSM